MSGPTYVRITADITDFMAKQAVFKAEVANSNSVVRNYAEQIRAAGSAAGEDLKLGLQLATQQAAQAKAELAHVNNELKVMNAETKGGGLKDIVSFGEGGVHFKLREIAEAFSAIGVAMAAVFVGREIIEGIEHTAELGANLLKLSEQTGIAVEALSGLHYAAEQEDVSADSLDTSVKRLGKSIQEALTVPTSKAAQAFSAMGISQSYLREHSNDLMAVFLKMADAFHDHADGARADAIAMATLGRGGVELIPVLRTGSEEIGKQIEKQKELGSQITGATAEAMKKHVQAVKDMGEAWRGLWITLSSGPIDLLTHIVIGFEHIALAARHAGDGFRALAALFGLVSNMGASKPPNFGAKSAPNGAYQMKPGDTPVAKKKEFANFEGKEPKDFFAKWKEQLDQTLLAQQLFGKEAEAYELQFWQDKLKIADAGGKNYVGAERQITSTVYQLESTMHRQAIEEARKAEQEKKRLQDQGYRDFKAKIDAEREAVKGHFAEELRLDQELINRARELYGQDSANFYEALKKKTADMKAEIDKQMEQYKKLTSTIGNSFDQMFRGMLEGTQNFSQAMLRLTASLIEDFARMAIQSAETWVLSKIREVLVTEQAEAQKTAAVAAGASAQAGIQTAAAAEGRAAQAVAGSATVFGDANKAAAGAYAAVAGIPFVGPILAPIAAATAFVGVMAFDVFSASGGMDIGPGVNPITQLHEKEMVLPAGLSERIRGMTDTGGGSPDVHFHGPFVQAIDTQTGMKFLMANIPKFAKEVGAYMAKNPSARPAY